MIITTTLIYILIRHAYDYQEHVCIQYTAKVKKVTNTTTLIFIRNIHACHKLEHVWELYIPNFPRANNTFWLSIKSCILTKSSKLRQKLSSD